VGLVQFQGLDVGQAQTAFVHAQRGQGEILGECKVFAVTRADSQGLQRCGPVIFLLPELRVGGKGQAIEETVYRLQFLRFRQRLARGHQFPPVLHALA